MDITKIPFNKYIGVIQSENNASMLELGFDGNMKNHIGSFHASAQFALAEACSGLALQREFPEMEGSVLPVLRKTEIKFRKPAVSKIKAKAEISDEAKRVFKQQIEEKGRAFLSVRVQVINEDGSVTMSGVYEWFVQKL